MKSASLCDGELSSYGVCFCRTDVRGTPDDLAITENVHEPIISRSDFETVQRILENAPVKRPNGDGEIHPLSGLLFCKDCGSKMHIRIDYRNGGKRHVAYCSEYHKGKAKNPSNSLINSLNFINKFLLFRNRRHLDD